MSEIILHYSSTLFNETGSVNQNSSQICLVSQLESSGNHTSLTLKQNHSSSPYLPCIYLESGDPRILVLVLTSKVLQKLNQLQVSYSSKFITYFPSSVEYFLITWFFSTRCLNKPCSKHLTKIFNIIYQEFRI